MGQSTAVWIVGRKLCTALELEGGTVRSVTPLIAPRRRSRRGFTAARTETGASGATDDGAVGEGAVGEGALDEGALDEGASGIGARAIAWARTSLEPEPVST